MSKTTACFEKDDTCQLSVEDYARFLKTHEQKLVLYANLDSPDDPEWSLKNQDFLEKQGLKPIPVYHPSEFFNSKYRTLIKDWCERYEYIGIGGVANAKLKHRYVKAYLDYVFYHMKSYTKFHGFGITGPRLLRRYPFYTVDSTSWLIDARFATITRWKDFKFGTCTMYKPKSILGPYKRLTDRIRNNTKEYLKPEKDITKLWQIRKQLHKS